MSAVSSVSRVAVLGLYLLSGSAFAKTLPLSENLIDLTSEQGEHLLLDSEARQAYWALSIQFVTQKNRAYCGVASIVMVLNALRVEAPSTPEFKPYNTFTQDNVFDKKRPKRYFHKPC